MFDVFFILYIFIFILDVWAIVDGGDSHIIAQDAHACCTLLGSGWKGK